MGALAAFVAADVGCSARPLVEGAVCGPPMGNVPFSLCGVVGGKSVAYVPPIGLYVRSRGVGAVTFEASDYDGMWLDVWGETVRWTDFVPHPVAGWLLRPPAGWVGEGEWLCGQSGTITHQEDHLKDGLVGAIDGALGALARLPACKGEGGPSSLHVNLTGGVLAVPARVPGTRGRCQIGFRADDTRITILLDDACPQPGAPVLLAGQRIVLQQIGDTTSCIGAGATLTLVADAPSEGGQHLLVDIPSMSAPTACGTPIDGDELVFDAAPIEVVPPAGP